MIVRLIMLQFLLQLFIFNLVYAARYALLVGNSSGGADASSLRYVKNDLESLSEILSSSCGFPKNQIVVLQDKTPAHLNDAVVNLRRVLSPSEDNLLLFYYTGHADQDDLKMGTERFPLQALKDTFTTFPASIRIGVFDACQSGSFTRLKGGKLSEPFLFKDDGKIKGQVILSSSSPTENAQESDMLKNSVFTFHFVNALRGSADMSGDRKVTLAEAYQYSYNHTVSSTTKTWGGTQHPSYQFQIQGEGDIVLADLNIRSAGILLKSGLSGDITIQDVNGNIVADVSKEKISEMMIALDPGRYSLYRSDGVKKWQSAVKVDQTATTPVTELDFTAITPQKSHSKGSEKRYTSLSVGVSGGVRRIVMKDLDEQMYGRFNGYSLFGMSPKFNFPYEAFSGGAHGELAIRGRYLITLNCTGSRWRDEQALTGIQHNIIDHSQSDVDLTFYRFFDIATFDIGTGYRQCSGKFRGLGGTAGLSLIGARYIMLASFTESLFDIRRTSGINDKGLKIIPFIAAGYSVQALSFLTIEVSGIWRFQAKADYLRSWSPFVAYDPVSTYPYYEDSFRYRFGGGEIGVRCKYTLRLKEVRE